MCISISDDDECSRIVHVSIIVLAIYTFGTSLLWWWLCTKLAKLCCDNEKKDSKGMYIAIHMYVRMYMSA